jgi:hypothetical protein
MKPKKFGKTLSPQPSALQVLFAAKVGSFHGSAASHGTNLLIIADEMDSGSKTFVWWLPNSWSGSPTEVLCLTKW